MNQTAGGNQVYIKEQVLVVSIVALNGQTNWTIVFCVLMQLLYVLPHALKRSVTMRCSSLNKEEDTSY